MKRASGQSENHHDGRSVSIHGPRTRMDNHYWRIEFSEKAGVYRKATSKR